MGAKSTKIIMMVLLAMGSVLLTAQEKFTQEYRVGPKDLLEISVFGADELSRTVRVSEDGKVSLPLLGEVLVDGLTKSELEKKLADLLGEKYVQNPQVTVFIREYQSKRVSVLGAVEKPGPYQLLGRQTLMQIVSEAGGLTRDAGSDIIIIRQLPDGTSTSLRISIDDLFLKGDAKLNVPLEAGDIVNIPVDKLVAVYVFGQVKNPGALQVKKSAMPTLLQAIAQAGGFTDRAARGGVVIKRKDETGKEKEIKVNARSILNNKTEGRPAPRERHGLRPRIHLLRNTAMNTSLERKEIDLQEYVRIVLKRKNILIAFTAVLLVFVAIFSFTATRLYRATATIMIDEPSSSMLNIQDIMSSGGYYRADFLGTYFNTQLKLLTSRSLAERVAKKMNFPARPEFQAAARPRPNPIAGIKDLVTLRWLFGSKKAASPATSPNTSRALIRPTRSRSSAA